MTTKKINVTQAADILQAAKDRDVNTVFSVRFIKRTTGEYRDMLCRFGVKKDLKGGTKLFNDAERALITVYDMRKLAYRSINLNGVVSLKIGGQLYTVMDNQTPSEHLATWFKLALDKPARARKGA